MKKLAVILIIIVTVIGGTGCMFNYPAESINDLALKYMENKYGEKFKYYAPYGDSLTGTHQLLVTCESFPDQGILVSIENYRHEEERVFHDNYLAVKYKDETREFIEKCACESFEEAIVFYDVLYMVQSDDLSPDASFEEYLADTSMRIQTVIEVKSSVYESDAQVEALAESIAVYGSYFNVSVIVLDDSEYGKDDRKELGIRMAYGKFVRCAKIVKSSDETKIKWLEVNNS